MTTLPRVMAQLQGQKPYLQAKYPLAMIGIFGSYSRGEARPDSDVDILVEFSRPVGFEAADLAIELEEILGEDVDLVSKKAITSERLFENLEHPHLNPLRAKRLGEEAKYEAVFSSFSQALRSEKVPS